MIDYDMSIEVYHASPMISHSKLRDLASKGPRYYASRHVSRTTPPPEDTEAQVFGQLFEDIVQGRAFDRDVYAVKPTDGPESNFSTKEGRAWKKAALARGQRIVTQDELDDMDEMQVALRENETAIELIRGCLKQVTLTVAYPGTPGLRARPDWLSATGCAVNVFRPYSLDLKTTGNLHKLVSGRGIVEFGYHSQAAIVRHTMLEEGFGDTSHYLLACEKARPYRCQVIEIPHEWLDLGWQRCKRQLARLAKHYESGSWPRVDHEMVALPPPPAWAANVVGDEDEAA